MENHTSNYANFYLELLFYDECSVTIPGENTVIFALDWWIQNATDFVCMHISLQLHVIVPAWNIADLVVSFSGALRILTVLVNVLLSSTFIDTS